MVDVRVHHLRGAADIPVAQSQDDAATGFAEEHAHRQVLEQLKEWMALASPPGRGPALLYIDCDHFKALCKDLSPALRELILKKVTSRLASHSRGGNSLARRGAHRFLLGLAPLDQPEGALRVAGAIVQDFAAPVRVGKIDVHLSVSVGIALFPEDGLDADALGTAAEQAAFEAKRQGGNAYARPARTTC